MISVRKFLLVVTRFPLSNLPIVYLGPPPSETVTKICIKWGVSFLKDMIRSGVNWMNQVNEPHRHRLPWCDVDPPADTLEDNTTHTPSEKPFKSMNNVTCNIIRCLLESSQYLNQNLTLTLNEHLIQVFLFTYSNRFRNDPRPWELSTIRQTQNQRVGGATDPN